MANTIEDLFVYLLFITDLFLIFFFLWHFTKTKTEKSIWAIVVYCGVDISVNLITELSNSGKFIYYSYAFFTAFEYSIFAYILLVNIKNDKFRKAIYAISIIYLFFLLSYYTSTKPRSIDSTPIGIETILIIIYSFYYLYEQMNDTTELFIYSKFQFWIVVGIMLYLAGSFFIYIFANQVDRQTLDNFWFLTMAFYVIKNVFFAVGIYVFTKKTKSKAKNFQPMLV